MLTSYYNFPKTTHKDSRSIYQQNPNPNQTDLQTVLPKTETAQAPEHEKTLDPATAMPEIPADVQMLDTTNKAKKEGDKSASGAKKSIENLAQTL